MQPVKSRWHRSAAAAFSRASASSSASAARSGSVMANVEPRPTTLSTAISPPIRSTRLLVMVMPSPVPSVLLAYPRPSRSKGRKMRSRNSGVMPQPVSLTVKR